MQTYVERTIWAIGRAEGLTGWMHRDAAGVVRVGAGMALEDEEAAKHLPFQLGMRAATRQEIGADYARVKGMAAARRAAFYRVEGAPVLEREVIDALLRTTLVGLVVELREVVPGFDGMGDETKSRLLAMRYRHGAGVEERGRRSAWGRGEIGFGLVGLIATMLER